MKSISSFLIAFLFAASAFAQMGDKYYIVKVYDHVKDMTYQVKSSSELKELATACKAEARAWSKALALARKEWKTMEGHEKSAFPTTCAYPMKFTKTGVAFKTVEKAQEKQAQLTEKLAETKCCGCGKKGKKKSSSGGSNAADTGLQQTESSKKRSAAKEESRKAREAEAEKVIKEARTLLEAKLAEVMSPPAEATAEH